MASGAAATSFFSHLSDDIVLAIFSKLESDPRDWARVSCVSSRFCTLVRDVCCKAKCSFFVPFLGENNPPGGWAAIHKISVCCPGLTHAGVLLENSDFGLEMDIGPNQCLSPGSSKPEAQILYNPVEESETVPDSGWTLFDDLYLDTVYDLSETGFSTQSKEEPKRAVVHADHDHEFEFVSEPISNKRRKKQHEHQLHQTGAHLAKAIWNPSREQGSKLLATRFRGDSLYICNWPGCFHAKEKREYRLFRGVFKDFKRSGVWRTIEDGGRRSRSGLECAFCGCRYTWDLHSAFCLRRVFGYHEDGEPVVRAYVCENGHVSGAWTEEPPLK